MSRLDGLFLWLDFQLCEMEAWFTIGWVGGLVGG